jgi:hypothetical protein
MASRCALTSSLCWRRTLLSRAAAVRAGLSPACRARAIVASFSLILRSILVMTLLASKERTKVLPVKVGLLNGGRLGLAPTGGEKPLAPKGGADRVKPDEAKVWVRLLEPSDAIARGLLKARRGMPPVPDSANFSIVFM